MAKDFNPHSNDKSMSGRRPPSRDPIPFESRRMSKNDARSTNSIKAETRVDYPGFWPRSLAGTGPIFLLGVAILSGLYPVLHYKKFTVANLKSDQQIRPGLTSQPSLPMPPLSKPTSITPAVNAGPGQARNAVSTRPGLPALRYRPMKYEATHKKAFGGCTGQLELTSARLHFSCLNEADLNIPVRSIAKAHKDGVVLESGERYHFIIANHTKGQVEAIFILWLNKVRQFHQPSRESSL